MDAGGNRRGRTTTHIGFADRHATEELSGDRELFGVGAAILVGDLALVWSDEMLRCSGISEAALGRARAVWDTMRTEVTAGQYLDRKSTRLNSSHANISYAVFCLKK